MEDLAKETSSNLQQSNLTWSISKLVKSDLMNLELLNLHRRIDASSKLDPLKIH